MQEDLTNENVIQIKSKNTQYLQFRRLLEYKNIKHAYSLGTDVNFRTAMNEKVDISSKEYKLSIKCYKSLCKALKINYKNLVKPMQCHTSNIKIVEKKFNLFTPDFNLEIYNQTDGLITNKKNIILSSTNADCILFLIYDPIKNVIANVHSGWKGTLQRIIVHAINRMIEEFKCNPKDIICCICPSIRKCHFEVDVNVKHKFQKEFKDLVGNKYINNQDINIIKLDDLIEESVPNKKWHIDTVLINKILLQNAGLIPQNIIDSEICSMCNSNLIHSYRNEKEGYGLETALIQTVL